MKNKDDDKEYTKHNIKITYNDGTEETIVCSNEDGDQYECNDHYVEIEYNNDEIQAIRIPIRNIKKIDEWNSN